VLVTVAILASTGTVMIPRIGAVAMIKKVANGTRFVVIAAGDVAVIRRG
jgi:hypothetical protein